jgi:serine/threonine protein kinase
VLLGLAHIHNHQVLHRDLKTQNIFVGAGGAIKVLPASPPAYRALCILRTEAHVYCFEALSNISNFALCVAT